jgi:hypothetical protein
VKIEAGKLELNPEPVNLAGLIDEVIGTAGTLAEKNKWERVSKATGRHEELTPPCLTKGVTDQLRRLVGQPHRVRWVA